MDSEPKEAEESKFAVGEKLDKLKTSTQERTREITTKVGSTAEDLKRRGQEAQERAAARAAELRAEPAQRPEVQKARELATQAVNDPTGTAYDIVELSKQSREAHEALNANRPDWQKFMGSTVGKITQTVIEMIPLGGDILNLVHGVVGQNVLSGEKLDPVDRLIHIAGGLIPGVPATPFVELVKIIRKNAEEAALAARDRDKVGMARHGNEAFNAGKQLKTLINVSRAARKK